MIFYTLEHLNRSNSNVHRCIIGCFCNYQNLYSCIDMRCFPQKYIQSYDDFLYYYNSFGIHKNFPQNTIYPYEIRVFYTINDNDNRLGRFDSYTFRFGI